MMDFSVLIKTHERPNCLRRLMASLHDYYPTVPVLVADDSPTEGMAVRINKIRGGTVVVHSIIANSGLSYGRNYLVDHCTTPYFLLFDDDFRITEDSDLEGLVEYVRNGIFDLAGASLRLNGAIYHFEGFLDLKPPDLHLTHTHQGDKPAQCDIVFNCFAGITEQIRDVRWDNELLMAEHIDFFLRCQKYGVSVGHIPGVIVDHCPDRENTEYAKARDQLQKKCEPIWRNKWGITNISGGLG